MILHYWLCFYLQQYAYFFKRFWKVKNVAVTLYGWGKTPNLLSSAKTLCVFIYIFFLYNIWCKITLFYNLNAFKSFSMLQFLLTMLYRDITPVKNGFYRRAKLQTYNKIIRCIHYFPLHSPLLKESWLVFIFSLRWLICLSLARILTRADVSKYKMVRDNRRQKERKKQSNNLLNSLQTVQTKSSTHSIIQLYQLLMLINGKKYYKISHNI